MIQAEVTELQSPRLERLQELLRSNGPCITVLLPPYRPGEQGKSMAGILKANLQDMAQQLAARRIPSQVIEDLLKPLEELTEDVDFSGGSHLGRVIFRSPDVLQQFALTAPVKARHTVGSYFQIRALLSDVYLAPEFYLLKLSKVNVELMRCANLRAERVKLPKGVPETLDEALAFKQPDHDLENRSASGGSTGAMRGVRFGTASDREKQRAYLADFYRMVDRGIAQLLHIGNAPLVLVGVDEDTAAYRMIQGYPNLLSQGIHGSPNASLCEQDLLQQAYSTVRADHVDRTAASLMDWKERLAPARFTTDLDAILRAAADGRIAKLNIDESAQRTEFLPEASQGARSTRGEEDLLNVAAVQTILHGGLAFGLPPNKVPEGMAVAAVLRY